MADYGFDMLTVVAKNIALGIPYSALLSISNGFDRLCKLAPNGKIRIASACSGSGIGDVSLHVLVHTLSNVINLDPTCVQTVFACESNPKKAQFLIDTLDMPIVFSDVRSNVSVGFAHGTIILSILLAIVMWQSLDDARRISP
jgi:hypothetical protein